ncbi:putative membrane protein YcfT [Pseudonocardia sediminis]|uniref:Putative membrane protein YcfT n=1 Tax=Pseudonocardia sediminis TaxID=1397368 RepID=A0A4Q7V3A7_PSEST|nr:acyltransferase family protein [Pseudonocardia sediminis]RZT87921.1 putative membrane protein YcfT [Pseudonocardia sediminis]
MTDLRPTAVASVTTRETWIDVAKGAAIVLVVLRHSQDAVNDHGQGVAAWNLLNDSLASVRMPLFFLVSGLFAARALQAPLARFGRSKLAHFGWLFALWAGVYVIGYAVWAAVTRQPEGAWWWATEAAAKDSTPWYLLALAVFFALARAARSLPPTAQLATTGAVSALFATETVTTGVWMFDRMGHYAVFFLAGCYGSSLVRAWVSRTSWWTVAGVGAAWAGAGVVVAVVGRDGVAGDLVLPLLGLPAALALLGRLQHARVVAPLAVLGRNTLPVYVLHFVAVLAVAELTAGWGGWWPLVAAPLVASAALALALAGARALRPVSWLWVVPVSQRRAASRA